MPRLVFLVVLTSMLAVPKSAIAGCPTCSGGAAADRWMEAEACTAPPGYCLVPGCWCDDTRRCDNAWAGYCQHRARVEACWANVGVSGKYGHRRPCRFAPATACDDCSP
jgi:hypothetical protein